MKDLIVHQVNIAHYRLIELAKLADQAKPCFDDESQVQLNKYIESLFKARGK